MNNINLPIITRRCLLREMTMDDAPGMFALDSNPEVLRYLGGQTVTSIEESLKTIGFVQQQYRDFGIGRWSVIDKKSGEFLGWCGLKWITEPLNNHVHYYDLGYRFRQKFWGQGLATECATACRDYAFESLSIQTLYAAAHVDNAASNRVLLKLGFQRVETCILWDHPHAWYEMKRLD